MNVMHALPQFFSDTGQKKILDKKDGRRMSFQKPKGTIEYTVSYCLATYYMRLALKTQKL